jgi:hypothetical protein
MPSSIEPEMAEHAEHERAVPPYRRSVDDASHLVPSASVQADPQGPKIELAEHAEFDQR